MSLPASVLALPYARLMAMAKLAMSDNNVELANELKAAAVAAREKVARERAAADLKALGQRELPLDTAAPKSTRRPQ